MRALVTAFDAFGGERVNASQAAIKRLPPAIRGMTFETLVLPTSFARAPLILAEGIADFAPDVVLCVGEAGDRHQLL